jgi:hypothetical protein
MCVVKFGGGAERRSLVGKFVASAKRKKVRTIVQNGIVFKSSGPGLADPKKRKKEKSQSSNENVQVFHLPRFYFGSSAVCCG